MSAWEEPVRQKVLVGWSELQVRGGGAALSAVVRLRARIRVLLCILRSWRREAFTMAYITLIRENIGSEHICCAFSDKKCSKGYELKKQWLATQFDQGYVFRLLIMLRTREKTD